MLNTDLSQDSTELPPIQSVIVSIIDGKSFLIRLNKKDVDLRIIYNPLYFHTIGLTAEIVTKSMKGGYYQKDEDLTFPFNYVVWMIEKNPITLTVSNYLQQQSIQSTPYSETPDLHSLDNSSFGINNLGKKIGDLFNSTQEQKEESHEDGDAQEDKESSQDEDDQLQQEEDDQLQEEEEEDSQSVEDPQQEGESQQPIESVIQPSEINIKIDIEPNIKNNGKDLSGIIKEYTQLPRTIESIPETGITYLLLEKIVFDLYSQKSFLYETYSMIYSEFRENTIFNLNDRYVILDVEKIVYLGTDENTKKEKHDENNKLFSSFIQKLKYGDIFVSNDTIIEYTNVEKLRLRLSS